MGYVYNVRPPRYLSWFITPITMVFGTYNYWEYPHNSYGQKYGTNVPPFQDPGDLPLIGEVTGIFVYGIYPLVN